MRRATCVSVLVFMACVTLCAQNTEEEQIGEAIKAIRNNNLPRLQELIWNPKILNSVDGHYGYSLLHWAVDLQREKMVRILLDAGSDFEKKTSYQKVTPLELACGRGNAVIFRMLISKGATLKSPQWLVLEAATGGSVEIMTYLVEKNLSLDVRDSQNESPLHRALQNGHREMVDFLLKSDRRLGDGPYLIHSAAYGGKIDLVETCLKLGQSIDSQDPKGWTPLHIAVLEKNIPLAEHLIARGASLNIRSKETWERHEDHVLFPDGSTPLYFAVLNNDSPMTDLIMGKVSRKEFDHEVVALFYYTRVYGYRNLCKHLIASCSDINVGDEHGWTLLHQAAFWDADEETIGMILDRGGNLEANTSAVFKDWRRWEFPAGSTPMDISRIVGGRNFPVALTKRGIASEEPKAYRWGPTAKGHRIEVSRDGSIWLVVPIGTVFYTEGVEKAWKSFPLEKEDRVFPRNVYTAIHWFDGQKAVAWGSLFDDGRCIVKVTEDRGKNWNPKPLGSLVTIYDVFSNAKGEGWMGGSTGEIFYSPDGGRHWEKRNSPFDPQTRMNSIFMTDSRSGIAGALADALCITRDNWRTFEKITTPLRQRNADFPKMAYSDNRFLRVAQWGKFYIVNQRGRVYYSLRDRVDWEPFSEDLCSFAIDPVSSRCLAVTSGRKVVELISQGDDIRIRELASSLLQALPVDIRALGSSLYVLDEESCIYKINEKEFIRRPIMVERQDQDKTPTAGPTSKGARGAG